MYKVLREVSEEVKQGQRGESSLSVGGRVRNPEFKAVVARQLGQALGSLEGAAQLDLKTGRIASKKVKKEKTQEQLALDEVKKFNSKLLILCWLFTWCISYMWNFKSSIILFTVSDFPTWGWRNWTMSCPRSLTRLMSLMSEIPVSWYLVPPFTNHFFLL